MKLFEENMHGTSPARPKQMTFDVFDQGTRVFGGKALRKQIEIRFHEGAPKIGLLLYTPAAAERSPVLLHLGFSANSRTVEDTGIRADEVWNRKKKRVPAATARAFPPLKVEQLLDNGFGFATVYYGDIEPDFTEGSRFGVRGAFPGTWGAIAAWAWGLSRAMDYLETDANVDPSKVAIVGVSKLGKTVLWAGAMDPRFALVIASCSGEGGASLMRRSYGETVQHVNRNFPYWFSDYFLRFGADVNALPVDAHMLVSLIAPRPVYLSTGDTDRWSDPKGEFLAAVGAEPVYKLLGKQGLGVKELPSVDEPVMKTIGYHRHKGGHGANAFDWAQYVKFLRMHLAPQG